MLFVSLRKPSGRARQFIEKRCPFVNFPSQPLC
jgi:hypothetical protein